MLTAAFTFGGEFILYGLAACCVAMAINAVRTFLSRR